MICEYFREFSKKFETALTVYSGAWGKLIHEKNQKQKISDFLRQLASFLGEELAKKSTGTFNVLKPIQAILYLVTMKQISEVEEKPFTSSLIYLSKSLM